MPTAAAPGSRPWPPAPAPLDRAGLVDALVSSLVVAAAGSSSGGDGGGAGQGHDDDLEHQALHNRLFGFAMRVADSGIASGGGADADAAFHAIKQRLQHEQRQDEAARLSELYHELCKHRGPLSGRGRGACLSLLQQLADHGGGIPSGTIGAYKPLQLPKVLARGGGGAAPGGGSGAPPDTWGVTGPTDQPSKARRSRSGAQQAGGAAAAAWQQPAPAGGDPSMAKEPALVRDVLRLVQGLTGTYAGFHGGGGGDQGRQHCAAAAAAGPGGPGWGVAVAPRGQLVLHAGMRTLVHELGELGLLYRRVQEAIAAGRRPGAGSVRQALCAALADEVTDFYRLIAVLEAQLAAPLPLPGGGDGAAEPGGRGPYLSLRRLQLWLAEPLRRMRVLAALADGSAGRLGGDLAGAVWAASKVGDPLASACATRVLHQMCVPLFDMIRRWVFEGRLEDPACEFFVVPSAGAAAAAGGSAGAGAAAAPDLWREAYRLEAAKLPPFLGPGLAATILRAGKSLNFLRDACGDGRWAAEWARGAAGDVAALGYGQLPVMERTVASAGRAVDARLMAVLRGTGELSRHCLAVRRYLLLGQGDFVVALLDCLGPELAKPARDVSEVALNHLLREALMASAGGGRGDDDGGGPQERLRARKAPAAEGETGWDVFSLHYQLGPPLSSIFTPEAQAGYGQLSRLLWLLRRAERSLGTAWHVLKVEVERSLPRLSAAPGARRLAEALLRSCLRLRAEMAHVATNLQYYIHLEVLECAWAEFMAAAAAAPDLDCLIAAHDRFVAGALERALLGPGKAEGLRRTLHQLIAACMGLAPLAARFNERVQAGLLVLERRAADAAANTAAGRWGSAGGGGEVVAEEELHDLHSTLGQLADTYRQLLRGFLKGLPDAANEVNAEVRFLLARLNFSDFYTRDVDGQQQQQQQH